MFEYWHSKRREISWYLVDRFEWRNRVHNAKMQLFKTWEIW